MRPTGARLQHDDKTSYIKANNFQHLQFKGVVVGLDIKPYKPYHDI